MTDQQTTTAEPTRRTEAEPKEPLDRDREAQLASHVREEAATERPLDTRDLRDAQSAAERQPERTSTPAAPATPAPSARTPSGPTGGEAALFDEAAGHELQERWLVIQTEFVDAPREAVEKADSLVAEVLKQLTDSFAREREGLEAAWSRGSNGSGDEASTEDLRQAIRRYRSFFNRLLTL